MPPFPGGLVVPLELAPPEPEPPGARATGPPCSLPEPEPAAAPEAFPGGTSLPDDPPLVEPGCTYIGIVEEAPLVPAFEESSPPLPQAAARKTRDKQGHQTYGV